MEKKPKHYKTVYNKFILLLVFTLVIGHGIFGQCTANTSGCSSGCATGVNVDLACNSCYATTLTDLKNTGIGPTATVTINAIGFAKVTAVKIVDINIYNPAPGCTLVPGGSFPNSTTFNGAGLNMNIAEGTDHVILSTSGHVLTGYRMNFIVNVYNGDQLLASRNYFTTLPSSSLIVGDTHISTVDGVKYDFQAVGEFVALKADGGDNLEIQVRQTAVATSGPGTDSYSGLTTCVSVNTAVAARVGTHRVTYQPNINGQPDSTGMQLRVDGTLTQIGNNGLNLDGGGRIIKLPTGGGTIEIQFPDGASLVVTPSWWAHYNQWYLNVSINNATARKGISGVIPYNDTTGAITRRSRSWLPALPDGSSVGPMPQNLHQRFVTLYQTFADAWRVTDATSFFDYAPGTSTATFTNKNWPAENPQTCPVTGQNPLPPIDLATAQQLTAGITNPILKANAIFDVMATGDPIFANTYLVTEKIQNNTTAIRVNASKDTSRSGEQVTFTATVARKFATANSPLTGSVEFTADGNKLGEVKLEANGRAILTTTSIEVGEHKIAARFIPDNGSTVFPSSSPEVTHTVTGAGGAGEILHQWWFWLLAVIVLLLILYLLFRKKNP